MRFAYLVAHLRLDEYFAAAHVGIEWGGGRRVTYDAPLISTGKRQRKQEIIAPNFTLVPPLVIGAARVATLPTRLAVQMAQSLPLRVRPCPLEIPRLTEMLQWHKYQERDPAIEWLRSLLRETAASLPVCTAPLTRRRRYTTPRKRA